MKIKMSYLALSISHFLLVGAAYALVDKLASNYLSLLDSGTLHTVLIAAMTVVIWLASSCVYLLISHIRQSAENTKLKTIIHTYNPEHFQLEEREEWFNHFAEKK